MSISNGGTGHMGHNGHEEPDIGNILSHLYFLPTLSGSSQARSLALLTSLSVICVTLRDR
jgi:hypothetical protein